MLVPSRVPSGKHEFAVRMFRKGHLGGSAEYVFPVTIDNPDFGKPLKDPAYAALGTKYPGAKIASIRCAGSAVELFPAFPGEEVIAVNGADAVIKPNNRDWDPRKNNFGGEKIIKFGMTPHDKDMSALFLKLDLQGLQDTEIKGAILRLTMVANWGKSALDWEVYALRRNWTEKGVCFYGPEGRKGPAWGKEGARDTATDIFPEPVATFHTDAYPASPTEKRRFISIDLSGIVKEWQQGSKPNYGILIRPAAGVPGGRDISICSNEFEDYPFRPSLAVAYESGHPVSKVRETAPAFPGAASAPRATVKAPKAKPASVPAKSKPSGNKPKHEGRGKKGVPEGFCILMSMDGTKITAKVVKIEGDTIFYEDEKGQAKTISRDGLAVLCP